MKLVNISNNLIYIIYVKDEIGNDRIVKMHPGDHVFSPTNEKTKSVTLQGLKKNIAVFFDEFKPNHLEYFVPYKLEQLDKIEFVQKLPIDQKSDFFIEPLSNNLHNEENNNIKVKVIELCKQGNSIKDISNITGLQKNLIKNWIKLYSKESGEILDIK